ncbi:MAG: NAD(+)/NADH kinase [Nitrososphaerota archaeon]|nr:NAD(+)/NADH kinase [Nitrososphaerota archaeon]MDG6957000.1 NAD(+)/NADH kinase [Nitrososphaerota archaeon]MDG6959043.1 NAD(+)/NADH kinase [Nitrososphaerota archaeon]MDG6973797.1 NAD(+)/NADH kinase [Nitrososphaerota archaeon]MDG6987274.1 NAD(+)/NADH kinase [Nitrososphaerota archaeon]
MKAALLLDGEAPKVAPGELRRIVMKAGIEVGEAKADFGIVVGGDGRFSRYGRTEKIPLLFVGVRSKGAIGSKARLAQTVLDELPEALARIRAGGYEIDEHRRLRVIKGTRVLGEVFTDVYLQRGAEGSCLRYKLKVSGKGAEFEEAAIADGIVVATRAGATGYYSYVDRIGRNVVEPSAFARIGRDEVGICHITPTYTERLGVGTHPLRYTVPWGSKIEISLSREADARLFGVTDSRAGIKVSMGEKVSIAAGKEVTKVMTLP